MWRYTTFNGAIGIYTRVNISLQNDYSIFCRQTLVLKVKLLEKENLVLKEKIEKLAK